MKTVAMAVSAFGSSVNSKLVSAAISGAPEDQLRGPLETLVQNLSEIGGLPNGTVHLIGETTLAHLNRICAGSLRGFDELRDAGAFTNVQEKPALPKRKSKSKN